MIGFIFWVPFRRGSAGLQHLQKTLSRQLTNAKTLVLNAGLLQ
jgi:hypothetical protein